MTKYLDVSMNEYTRNCYFSINQTAIEFFGVLSSTMGSIIEYFVVLSSFSEYYRVLPSTVEYYRVLSSTRVQYSVFPLSRYLGACMRGWLTE